VAHGGIGLVTLAAVCALVFRLMQTHAPETAQTPRSRAAAARRDPFSRIRFLKLLAALFLPVCAA
jgi:hypothetical protein